MFKCRAQLKTWSPWWITWRSLWPVRPWRIPVTGCPLWWLGGCSTLWLSSGRTIALCSQWTLRWLGSWSDECALMFWQLVGGIGLCWLLPCHDESCTAWQVSDVVFGLLAVASSGVAASHSHSICCGIDVGYTLQLFFAPFRSCGCCPWCVGPILWWHIPEWVWQVFGLPLSSAWGS